MAGDQQTRSGTPFDPSPQFWIEGVEPGRLQALTGRCWFAPVTVGMRFGTVALNLAGRWETFECRLVVEEINANAHLVDELDQLVSARIVVSGNPPASLSQGSVLVARDSPVSGKWERRGTLWQRQRR